MRKLGIVPQRLVLFAFADEFGDTLTDGEFQPEKYTSERVCMTAVKLVADGSVQGYTGHLEKPYHRPFHVDDTYRGYPAIPREDLFEVAAAGGVERTVIGGATVYHRQ